MNCFWTIKVTQTPPPGISKICILSLHRFYILFYKVCFLSTFHWNYTYYNKAKKKKKDLVSFRQSLLFQFIQVFIFRFCSLKFGTRPWFLLEVQSFSNNCTINLFMPSLNCDFAVTCSHDLALLNVSTKCFGSYLHLSITMQGSKENAVNGEVYCCRNNQHQTMRKKEKRKPFANSYSCTGADIISLPHLPLLISAPPAPFHYQVGPCPRVI